jgi:hypothetical protein
MSAIAVDVTAPLRSFADTGYAHLGSILDHDACGGLEREIRARSASSTALFQRERDFRASTVRSGFNPAPGRNVLEVLDTGFVDRNPVVDHVLTSILGSGYRVLFKKVVAAIPGAWIPKWVKKELEQMNVPNLGAFVKPEFRHITYFHGILYHQDIIDYRERPSDFVTLYAYLNDVGPNDSPLYLLPGSCRFGATPFPHDVEYQERGRELVARYTDGRGRQMDLQHEVLTGIAGSVYVWHPCCLHGTLPSKLAGSSRGNRISLRYIVAKGDGSSKGLIDDVNDRIEGPLMLASGEMSNGPAGSRHAS